MTGAPPEMVPQGPIPTPFHDRLQAATTTHNWMNWAGYLSPAVVNSVEMEYFAIRNQAALLDISPMHKYRIAGPDATPVINRLVTRDIARVGDGRVGYAIWCDEEGMVIDDGTIFRFNCSDYWLCCQAPMYTWLRDAGAGFEVEITDLSHTLAALALQGPTAFSTLQAAGFGHLADLRPFDYRKLDDGVLVSRTGFTGDLGYELWCSNEAALALWDRLWAAGKNFGIRAIGFEAVNIARLEAGYIAAGHEFQPVHDTVRLHRGRTPLELGLERFVDFDKGHFNGRRALLKQHRNGCRYHLVKVELGGYKPGGGALIYHRKRHEIGHVTTGLWSPTSKRNIGFAELKAPFGAAKRDNLWAEIYLDSEGQWNRRLVPLTISDRPFFIHPRARATPPRPY